MKSKKRLAIVNQRYGLEVNGGSERYTRALAEHLEKYYDIEVITTCALNYDTWENYYCKGEEKINGITVRRFPVKRERKMERFRWAFWLVIRFPFFKRITEEIWLKEQGPYVPKLVEYIKKNQRNYDGFIFVTYLYYPIVKALPWVGEKSILIPTAHDESYIRYGIYKKVFQFSRGILYLTEEEKTFVEGLFDTSMKPNKVIAMGIEENMECSSSFYTKQGIGYPYVIYAGRIEEGKKCDELFSYFCRYKKENENALKLILIGKAIMEIPKEEDIIYLGFLQEDEKNSMIRNARALIMPSVHESLSIAVLEAMQLKVPVLVNGVSEVLKAHCINSKGGLFYYSYDEFKRGLDFYVKYSDEYMIMKENASKYVREKYNWEEVEQELVDYINNILERKKDEDNT